MFPVHQSKVISNDGKHDGISTDDEGALLVDKDAFSMFSVSSVTSPNLNGDISAHNCPKLAILSLNCSIFSQKLVNMWNVGPNIKSNCMKR